MAAPFFWQILVSLCAQFVIVFRVFGLIAGNDAAALVWAFCFITIKSRRMTFLIYETP